MPTPSSAGPRGRPARSGARADAPPADAARLLATLAEQASQAEALFAQFLSASERALCALESDDGEGLLAALAERDPLRDRITPLVQSLVAARVGFATDPRRAGESRALRALLAPVEALATRVRLTDARLAELAGASRDRLARELEQVAHRSALVSAYDRASGPSRRRLERVGT